jgi:hypothetical protein
MKWPLVIRCTKIHQHIYGVSKGKYARYGKKFAETIKAYVESNDILRPEDIVVKSVSEESSEQGKNRSMSIRSKN